MAEIAALYAAIPHNTQWTQLCIHGVLHFKVVEFEWDENKRESNLQKHGIDFEYAKDIWNGPTFEYPARSSQSEIRKTAIGQFGDVLIAIVYTDCGERRRLISARRANRKEREHYENEIG